MTSTARESWRQAEAVAGLLAAGALFLGFMQLFYRPFRLAPVAVILLLIATVMSTRQQRLIGLGFAVVGDLLRRRRGAAAAHAPPAVLDRCAGRASAVALVQHRDELEATWTA